MFQPDHLTKVVSLSHSDKFSNIYPFIRFWLLGEAVKSPTQDERNGQPPWQMKFPSFLPPNLATWRRLWHANTGAARGDEVWWGGGVSRQVRFSDQGDVRPLLVGRGEGRGGMAACRAGSLCGQGWG